MRMRNRSARLMSSTNTAPTGLFKQEGASHIGEAPLQLALPGSARDDQAFAGYDHPAAVLAPDRVDPAKSWHGIAGIDLVKPLPAFDERAAMADIAQDPAVAPNSGA